MGFSPVMAVVDVVLMFWMKRWGEVSLFSHRPPLAFLPSFLPPLLFVVGMRCEGRGVGRTNDGDENMGGIS